MHFWQIAERILQYIAVYRRPSINKSCVRHFSGFIEYLVSVFISITLESAYRRIYRNSVRIATAEMLYSIANSCIRIINLVVFRKHKRTGVFIYLEELIIQSKLDHCFEYFVFGNFAYVLFHTEIRFSLRVANLRINRDGENIGLATIQIDMHAMLISFLTNIFPSLIGQLECSNGE